MNKTIRFQRGVPLELERLLNAYEDISLQASNKVRESLSETFSFIETFPEMYAIVFDDIRIVSIKDYPILIQYRIVGDSPVVISVTFSVSPK